MLGISSCGYPENSDDISSATFIEEVNKDTNIINLDNTASLNLNPILSIIELPIHKGANIVYFGFKSSMAGTIGYFGSCFSPTRRAINGAQFINFVTLVEVSYDNCAIQVKDSNGNMSEPLTVPTFSVDFTAPELSQNGSYVVKERKIMFELNTNESGKIIYSGNCSGDLQNIKKGKFKVMINFPGDGQYSDCELSVADSAGNFSVPLSLGTVRIDTTPPALTEINPVPEKIQTDRLSYSFKTSKSGNLTFSGKCKGNVDKAVAGINHIALLTGEPGTYDDCMLTLTDSSKNQSQPLNISPFEVLGNS